MRFRRSAGAALAAMLVLPCAAQTLDPMPRTDVVMPDDMVIDTAIAGDTLYVAGTFENVGGTPRQYVAAVDLISGALLAWDPQIDTLIAHNAMTVNVIEPHGDVVYIGGFYRETTANRPVPLLLAIDAATGAPVPGFTPPTEPEESIIRTVLCVDDAVIAGTSNGEGLGSGGVVSYDQTTGTFGGMLQATNGDVVTLALTDDDSTLFFGGDFVGPTSRVGALETSTWSLLPWSAAFSDDVSALDVIGDELFVGGRFLLAGGALRRHAASFSTTTAIVTDWHPEFEGPGTGTTVNSITSLGPLAILGGQFAEVAGVARYGVASIHATNGVVYDWNPDFSSHEVHSVSAHPSFVVAGGEFTAINGELHHYLAVFENDLDGAPDCNENGLPDAHDIKLGLSVDCNANGVPDECDIASAESDDCNGNGTPDECEISFTYHLDTGVLTPIDGDTTHTVLFEDLREATGDVCITLSANADLGESTESIRFYMNGNEYFQIFWLDGVNCTEGESYTEFCVQDWEFNEYLNGETFLEMVFDPRPTVDGSECSTMTYLTVTMDYVHLGPNDADQNGVPDDCPVPCPADLDQSGDVGFGDLVTALSAWGPCDACPADLDDDGVVGFSDVITMLSAWGPC